MAKKRKKTQKISKVFKIKNVEKFDFEIESSKKIRF